LCGTGGAAFLELGGEAEFFGAGLFEGGDGRPDGEAHGDLRLTIYDWVAIHPNGRVS
jgi:hypothetical protein